MINIAITIDQYRHNKYGNIISQLCVSIPSVGLRRLLHLSVLGLPCGMKLDVAILLVALVAQRENHVPVGKVARVMVRIVFLDALPANVHNVAVVVPVDRLNHLAARHTKTSIDVADNVRPQRPGPDVPRLVRLNVHGRPREGGAVAQGLAVGRELLDECVPRKGHVAGDDELAQDGLQASILRRLLEVLVLGEVVSYCNLLSGCGGTNQWNPEPVLKEWLTNMELDLGPVLRASSPVQATEALVGLEEIKRRFPLTAGVGLGVLDGGVFADGQVVDLRRGYRHVVRLQ